MVLYFPLVFSAWYLLAEGFLIYIDGALRYYNKKKVVLLGNMETSSTPLVL